MLPTTTWSSDSQLLVALTPARYALYHDNKEGKNISRGRASRQGIGSGTYLSNCYRKMMGPFCYDGGCLGIDPEVIRALDESTTTGSDFLTAFTAGAASTFCPDPILTFLTGKG
jgi:hypothetical protein